MNDPNGFIQWGSTYHLFYQHNPHAPIHADMHCTPKVRIWSTGDTSCACADPGGPDSRGCWSG
jgi:beta-fructofuranosidase